MINMETSSDSNKTLFVSPFQDIPVPVIAQVNGKHYINYITYKSI